VVEVSSSSSAGAVCPLRDGRWLAAAAVVARAQPAVEADFSAGSAEASAARPCSSEPSPTLTPLTPLMPVTTAPSSSSAATAPPAEASTSTSTSPATLKQTSGGRVSGKVRLCPHSERAGGGSLPTLLQSADLGPASFLFR